MHCSQLTRSLILVSLVACTSEPRRFSSGFGSPGAGGDLAGSGGAAAGTTDEGDAAAPDDLDASGAAGGSADGAAGSPFAPDGPVMVMHGDASAAMCSRDRATLGGSGLLAAGATPPTFAAAFNAEVTNLKTGGPFLLVLSGVNQGSSGPQTASFGALDVLPDGVGFAGPPAVVPFSIEGVRMIQIPMKDAVFDLRFVAPASPATIPVASVEMTGALANACTSMTIATLRMLVPATASGIAFHGSTVGALMGTPTASVQGGANNAWPLELSGKVKQVTAIIPEDAGEGPL